MSAEEQDAIVGRLIREKSDALRRKAAIDAEIKLVSDTCEMALVRGHMLKTEQIAAKLELIRKYFNVDAYLALLQDREQAQNEVIDRIKRLRDLGVEH